ncbi:HEAT repeat domain-containing protein [Patescibacteria group bacterium]|nr:HEAT repeat domain-containing protein [Patescibacteria group bacterium]MBU4016224.1 HEAT repeat domain-containing protein [Patescibacteria group bacterium]MBU4099297.1 HEAT repeat domain-containing protein [Patescibacteria group bacterium]
MVTKVSDVKNIVKNGIQNPKSVFSQIRQMAESEDWKIREVAATALVEISKKKTDEVVEEMSNWAKDSNPNVRRTASEGLRDVARKNPDKVIAVLDKLKTDKDIYVKKSVANVLRNATRNSAEFVLNICLKWALLKNPDTNWIIKDGLRKAKTTNSKEVERILKSLA